jgi:hypothetical protein
MDKCQTLAVLCVKILTGRPTKAIPVQLFVGALQGEEARINLRYCVKFSHAKRGGLKALLTAGEHPVSKSKRTQILLALTLEPRGRRPPSAWR